MQPGGGSELAVDIELAFGKLLDGVELISGDLDSLTLELAGVGIRQRADLHRFDSEHSHTEEAQRADDLDDRESLAIGVSSQDRS